MRIRKLKMATAFITIVVISVAAGVGLLRVFASPDESPTTKLSAEGAVLFEKNCAQCHYSDKVETKMGPGLKGLFKRDKLPVSGRDATDDNVRRQLKTPFKNMPSFARLSEPEITSL